MMIHSAPHALAQPQGEIKIEDLDIVEEPICFTIRNEADYRVYGSFVTDYYPDPTGVNARHRSDFRLEAKGKRARNHETGVETQEDRSEFCTYGPFLPGRQLELTLRTLFPIFDCKTRVDRGEIIITGRRKPEGGTETTATCFQ